MTRPEIGIPFKGGPLSESESVTGTGTGLWTVSNRCPNRCTDRLITGTRPANQRIGTTQVVTQANESCNRLTHRMVWRGEGSSRKEGKTQSQHCHKLTIDLLTKKKEKKRHQQMQGIKLNSTELNWTETD